MFFLPIAIQENIFFAQHITFVLSTILNITSLICLFKETPPHQSTFKNYLILIQMLLTLNDIDLDILFAPIPLFPAQAGYCVGLLCKAKVSMHIQLGILILLIANIGVAIIICVMYRHQTILLENDRLKMKKRTKLLIRTFLFVLFSAGPIFLMFLREDEQKMEQMIDSYPHNISWIRDRGDLYLAVERTPSIIVVISTILLILFVATCALVFMFGHMFSVLGNTANIRSVERSERIRKSLFVLLIQLIVPICLLVVPATVMFVGLLTVDWISFEISLVMYLILPFHSIGHNVILLAITPVYRNFISYFVQRYLLRRKVNRRVTIRNITTNT